MTPLQTTQPPAAPQVTTVRDYLVQLLAQFNDVQLWTGLLGLLVFLGGLAWWIYGLGKGRRSEQSEALAREKKALQDRIDVLAKAPTGPSILQDSAALALHGITRVYPETNRDSEARLMELFNGAQRRITIFGLTRNFYTTDAMRLRVLARSLEIPVSIYLSDDCAARNERYRIEPGEASYNDFAKFDEEILTVYRDMLARTTRIEPGSSSPGLTVNLFDFTISYAIEQFDDTYRVSPYGHGLRGTECPIFEVEGDSEFGRSLERQIDWLHQLATQRANPIWTNPAKKLSIRPLE